ncbi:hypothetical protein VTO73DRAFT_8873 [Trametes versicolor]
MSRGGPFELQFFRRQLEDVQQASTRGLAELDIQRLRRLPGNQLREHLREEAQVLRALA